MIQKLIVMPFYERFRKPLANGVKTWSTRSRKYVDVGELFSGFDMVFQCDAVLQLTFKTVLQHWREEGFNSKQDFIETWAKIHPRVSADLYRVYYVHIFHRVPTKIVKNGLVQTLLNGENFLNE